MKFSKLSKKDKAQELYAFGKLKKILFFHPSLKCKICHQKISINQEYYDYGIDKRAHKHCVDREIDELI